MCCLCGVVDVIALWVLLVCGNIGSWGVLCGWHHSWCHGFVVVLLVCDNINRFVEVSLVSNLLTSTGMSLNLVMKACLIQSTKYSEINTAIKYGRITYKWSATENTLWYRDSKYFMWYMASGLGIIYTFLHHKPDKVQHILMQLVWDITLFFSSNELIFL